MSSDQPLRWGILGASTIARVEVIPALMASPSNQLVAVASRDRQRAIALAHDLGARAVDSYAALLRDPDVEAIYLSLPNTLHAEWTIRALQAGKHVLCEKPLAPTLTEVQRMIATARATGRVLMEAFMYRCHPRHQRALSLVADGAVGAVRCVRATYTYRLDNAGSDIRGDPDLGGGALLDVGCYCVDAILALIAQEPVRVAANVLTRSERGVDLRTSGVLTFEDGCVGQFFCSLDTFGAAELDILGERGRLRLSHAFRLKPSSAPLELHIETPSGSSVESFPYANQYVAQAEAFAQSVRTGAPLVVPLADSERTAAVLTALADAGRATPTNL